MVRSFMVDIQDGKYIKEACNAVPDLMDEIGRLKSENDHIKDDLLRYVEIAKTAVERIKVLEDALEINGKELARQIGATNKAETKALNLQKVVEYYGAPEHWRWVRMHGEDKDQCEVTMDGGQRAREALKDAKS
jgi:hypothetical protein